MEGFMITNTPEDIPSGEENEMTDSTVQANEKIHGLTEEEKNDVNKIRITISEKNGPVIVLFGPASCGKTMTLIRLSRFLQKQGYQLVPDETFRPSKDKNYKNLCDNFSSIVNSNDAASRTDNISFMLVKVIKDGRTICQILEGPGELYFDPQRAIQSWPTYVHQLLNNSELRKIFVTFVEPNFADEETRRNYVSTLNQLRQGANKQKYVFLYNKIDKVPYFVITPGTVHIKEAKHQVEADYPGIFTKFKNANPITSLWRPYDFDFVPFQTGTYTQPAEGPLVYIEGSDKYPQILWETLMKYVRG